MKRIFKNRSGLLVALLAMAVALLPFNGAWAEDSKGAFTVSPMNQKLILDPGESYTASFKIHAPATNNVDMNYEISVGAFYVDEDYETTFDEAGDMNQIVDWITIDSAKKGKLTPNEGEEVIFTIDVPKDAPAGGQYATIKVTSKADESGESTSGTAATVQQVFQIAHLVFAEITGDTIHNGEIAEINVPSFLLSGNIAGTSAIKNTGNVHGSAKYTLQVFPLFSGEEVYTNEEEPETRTILPDRTLYNELTWENTPAFGIFNVIYTVEFEGVTAQVSKLVIKCPIWLLAIIIFIIAVLIIWLIIRARGRKK